MPLRYRWIAPVLLLVGGCSPEPTTVDPGQQPVVVPALSVGDSPLTVKSSIDIGPRFSETDPSKLLPRFEAAGGAFRLRVRQSFDPASGVYELAIAVLNTSQATIWSPILLNASICVNHHPKLPSLRHVKVPTWGEVTPHSRASWRGGAARHGVCL